MSANDQYRLAYLEGQKERWDEELQRATDDFLAASANARENHANFLASKRVAEKALRENAGLRKALREAGRPLTPLAQRVDGLHLCIQAVERKMDPKTNEEIARLRTEVARLKAKVATLENERHAEYDKIGDLEGKVTARDRSIDRLNNTLKQQDAEVKNLENQLELAHKSEAEANRKRDEAIQAEEQAKQEAGFLMERVGTLGKEVLTGAQSLKRQESFSSDMKKDNVKLSERITGLENDNAQLKTEVERLKAVEHEYDSLKPHLALLNDELHHLEQSDLQVNANHVGAVQDLRDELARLREQVQICENHHGSRADGSTHPMDIGPSLDDELKSVDDDNPDESSNTSRALREDVDRLQHEKAHLNAQLEHKEGEIKRLREEMEGDITRLQEEKEGEIKRLQEEEEGVIKRLQEEKEGVIKRLQDESEKLLESHELTKQRHKEELISKDVLMKAQKRRMDRLENERKFPTKISFDNNVEPLRDEIQQLRGQIDKLQAELEVRQKEDDPSKKQPDDAKPDPQVYIEANEKLTAQIRDLEEKLRECETEILRSKTVGGTDGSAQTASEQKRVSDLERQKSDLERAFRAAKKELDDEVSQLRGQLSSALQLLSQHVPAGTETDESPAAVIERLRAELRHAQSAQDGFERQHDRIYSLKVQVHELKTQKQELQRDLAQARTASVPSVSVRGLPPVIQKQLQAGLSLFNIRVPSVIPDFLQVWLPLLCLILYPTSLYLYAESARASFELANDWPSNPLFPRQMMLASAAGSAFFGSAPYEPLALAGFLLAPAIGLVQFVLGRFLPWIGGAPYWVPSGVLIWIPATLGLARFAPPRWGLLGWIPVACMAMLGVLVTTHNWALQEGDPMEFYAQKYTERLF